VRRPIEFNLECLRAAIPQPDDSVRLLASPNWKITLLGFKSIAELRAAGCSEDEDALPLYREGPGNLHLSPPRQGSGAMKRSWSCQTARGRNWGASASSPRRPSRPGPLPAPRRQLALRRPRSWPAPGAVDPVGGDGEGPVDLELRATHMASLEPTPIPWSAGSRRGSGWEFRGSSCPVSWRTCPAASGWRCCRDQRAALWTSASPSPGPAVRGPFEVLANVHFYDDGPPPSPCGRRCESRVSTEWWKLLVALCLGLVVAGSLLYLVLVACLGSLLARRVRKMANAASDRFTCRRARESGTLIAQGVESLALELDPDRGEQP